MFGGLVWLGRIGASEAALAMAIIVAAALAMPRRTRIDQPAATAAAPAAADVVVRVTDFGAGIAAENVPRLTERFYRVDADASRRKKGTGLGLAIVKHIVTRHRGELSIASELGKGTTVSVYLPL